MANFFEQLRTGNSPASAPINAGLDFAGAGGLYIGKRTSTSNWVLVDTDRGTEVFLSTSSTNLSEVTDANIVDSFDSTGITIGSGTAVNSSGSENLDLLFLQEAGFLDVITFTGNGVNGRALAHNLGTEVGHYVVKSRAGNSWYAWAKSMTAGNGLLWNTNQAQSPSFDITASLPDTNNIYLSSSSGGNGVGINYVAYVFAHNPDKNIFCGNYTGTGVAGNKQTIGFKPRFLLTKPLNAIGGWSVQTADMNAGTGDVWPTYVQFNSNAAKANLTSSIIVEDDGFSFAGGSQNQSGNGFIYIAIGDVLPTGIPLEFRGNDVLLYQYLLTQGYTGTINEVIAKWLLAEGYDGQINEAKYKYLESLGYTDFTLPARDYKWRNNL